MFSSGLHRTWYTYIHFTHTQVKHSLNIYIYSKRLKLVIERRGYAKDKALESLENSCVVKDTHQGLSSDGV